MNSLVEHQLPILQETRSLRLQLLDTLTDADLAYQPAGNPTLGALCRESGQLDRIYIDSFGSFSVDWAPKPAPVDSETSVSVLRGWYVDLDRDLCLALGALTEEQVQGQLIDRGGDFVVPVTVHFHICREATLIFCAKASVYLQGLDKPLSEQWETWIG